MTITEATETNSQRRKRLARRDMYRGTVCVGCRHNYYNYAKPADRIGVAVAADYSCWWIGEIKRGKCGMKS